jgi:two-component system sensor histidine kinase CreC
MPAPDRRRFLGHIRIESGRLRELVDRLLELSSLEKRRGLRDVGELDLAEVLREVTRALEPILSARRLTIEWGRVDTERVMGERFLVRQSLANLLQNAAEFSAPGGTIGIDIEVHRDGGWVEVRIRDHGPGIPTYALGRVFDRFYSLARPDSGKNGSGLGLTFVREAVALHGGTVRLENAGGGGARAVLRLPVKPAAGSLED